MANKPLDLAIIALKSFVPAKDFDLSMRFYNDIGFTTSWHDNQLALMDYNGFKFLLQNFYLKDHAENYVMHLLVTNADHWWEKINQANSNKGYNIQLTAREDRTWGIRDFILLDPSGVMWRIGNELPI
ncbi:VOC family protein [Parapedobacter sp. 2B3]|uniref:VOC family protein n=1 Tax=Parapedobacter sp. 2B3 TaxID=3342381 RepID=UPI0035B5A5B2